MALGRSHAKDNNAQHAAKKVLKTTPAKPHSASAFPNDPSTGPSTPSCAPMHNASPFNNSLPPYPPPIPLPFPFMASHLHHTLVSLVSVIQIFHPHHSLFLLILALHLHLQNFLLMSFAKHTRLAQHQRKDWYLSDLRWETIYLLSHK